MTDLALLQGFRSRCREAGFDLVHPFRVDAYNARVDASLKLPDFDRTASLGLLVGNTRFLWNFFLRALRREPSRREDAHPLDRYVVDSITAAAECLVTPRAILFAHDVTVPVQRIAHASGFAWSSPSHLSIHPVYGPWLSFRAVVVLDEEAEPLDSTDAPDPCTSCHKPCLVALDRAVSASRTLDEEAVAEHFGLWRRVREVCPEGRGYAYDEDQLRYHYTKERELLRRVIE